jgi:hypothetical protein
MANVIRKWTPAMLIALATAASLVVSSRLPSLVELRFEPVFPFGESGVGEPLARPVVLFLMPVLSLVLWLAFRAAPTIGGQRFARRVFRGFPEASTNPEQFDRFSSSYDTILLGVVVLCLGLHAAILAAVLQYGSLASRLIPIVMGSSLVLMGNVMPRLRPNWVAGIRVKRALNDPQLWRSTHRAFGTAFVVSGLLTIVVGVIAPKYGVVTGLASIIASCVVGFVASTRGSIRPPSAALVLIALVCASSPVLGG